jgi:hypothetical protein
VHVVAAYCVPAGCGPLLMPSMGVCQQGPHHRLYKSAGDHACLHVLLCFCHTLYNNAVDHSCLHVLLWVWLLLGWLAGGLPC